MIKLYFTTICCIIAFHAFSQQIKLDLTKGKKISFSQTISPQQFNSVLLVNRLVAGDYNIKIAKTTIPVTVPDLSALAGGPVGASICTGIKAAQQALDGETDEENIPAKVSALKKLMTQNVQSSCKNEVTEALASISKTEQEIILSVPIMVEKGEKLTITITRGNEEWTYEFVCPSPEHVKLYFGLTYVPDALSKFDNYYAKEDTGGTYLISKTSREKHLLRNISPTVMVTYHFFNKENQAIKFGLTGGFSYNLKDLGVLFGPSMTIGDIISVNTGISFVQKDVLKGQYQEGGRIRENLEFDQLHYKGWTYDLFFSVGLRVAGLFNKIDEKEAAAKK